MFIGTILNEVCNATSLQSLKVNFFFLKKTENNFLNIKTQTYIFHEENIPNRQKTQMFQKKNQYSYITDSILERFFGSRWKNRFFESIKHSQ